MNYEKQCPSARNHAPLNRGVSPDRNALAKAAGARGSSAPNPPVRGASLPSVSALRRHRSLWACEPILGF